MWTEIAKLHLVNAKWDSRWLVVCDYLIGPKVLRFNASGDWQPFANYRCGPDGTQAFQITPERMVLTKASPGCLIGKLGGSAASLDEPGSTLFAIGSFAVIAIADRFVGPLYISFNLDRSQPVALLTQLELLVDVAEWPFPPEKVSPKS